VGGSVKVFEDRKERKQKKGADKNRKGAQMKIWAPF